MTLACWIVLTWLAFGAMHWLYVLTYARVGRACGGTVQEVKVGFGPTVFRRTVRDVVYLVKLVPLGGSTKFLDEEDEAADPEGVARSGATPFGRLPAPRRVLILASGPISSLLLGLILGAIALALPTSGVAVDPGAGVPIRPTGVPGLALTDRAATVESLGSLLRGAYVEFWRRVVTCDSLVGWGGSLAWVVTCAEVAVRSPAAWCTCLGAVCLSNGLLNLVPIPPLSGGQIALTLLETAVGRRIPSLTHAASTIGILAVLLFWLRICYADLIWFARWLMAMAT